MKPSKNPFFVFLCWFVISMFFIVCGLVLTFIWPTLVKYIIETNMVLNPNTHTYDLWKKFPVDFPIDFYFFNWTNPEDIYNSSVKPKFQQLGPYRFIETREKSNITWNRNGTVTFKHLKHWHFQNKEKNGDLNDPVTTINPVPLSAAYTARSWSLLLRKGLSVALEKFGANIHITRSVKQMLFEGYQDPLITTARSMSILSEGMLPPWDKFGWFYTRNGSTDFEGTFNMGTGHKTTLGKLYSWNNWTKTPYYEGTCGEVKGSAGEFFPSPLNKDSIAFFSPDLCRTITLEYVGENVVDHVSGYKYALTPRMLDNGTLYPENKCYCNGECVPSGLLNVSSCRYGSPSFASLPHFYNADPYYLDLVEGLQADKKKHEFSLTLEPSTGIPLQAQARLQINLLLQPISGIASYVNAPKVFFPMLWFEQKVQIPDNEAFKLRLLINMPVICSAVGILMIFVGLIVLSCVIYKICTMNLCSGNKNKRLYGEQNVPLKIEYHGEIIKKM